MKTVEELSSIKQQPHQQQHNEKNLCLMQTVECCDFSEMLKDVRGILKNSLSFQTTVQTTNTSLDNLKTITSATLNKAYPKFIQNIQTSTSNKPLWKSILFNDKNHYNLNNTMSLNVTNSHQAIANHQATSVFSNKQTKNAGVDNPVDEQQKPRPTEPSAKSNESQRHSHYSQRKQFVSSNISVKLKTIPVIEHKIQFTPTVPNSSPSKKTGECNTENFLPAIKTMHSISGAPTKDDLSTSQLSTSRIITGQSTQLRASDAVDRSDMLSDTLIVSKISPLNKYDDNWNNTDQTTQVETNETIDKDFKSLSFTIDGIDDPFIKNALKNKNELDAFIYSAKLQFTKAMDNDECPPPNSPVGGNRLNKVNQVFIKPPIIIQSGPDVANARQEFLANIKTELSLNGSSVAYHLTEKSAVKQTTKQVNRDSAKTMNVQSNRKINSSSSKKSNEKVVKLPTVKSVNNKLVVDIYLPTGTG